MKEYKDLTFLEKAGGIFLLSPVLIICFALFNTLAILYDGFIFQQIWNLLIPKLFDFPPINLVTSIVIGLIIGYHRISVRKQPPIQWTSVIVVPLTFWLFAYVVSLFI